MALPMLFASAAPALADTDVRVYGFADVSIDEVNNGLKTGTFITSNLSNIGFRATHDIAEGVQIIAQVEGQADIAATPSVKDTFGFRDSYLGFASKTWGTLKAGKSDTPYKRATAAFDPFSRSIGDYNALVGNTGGDNRAEFDLRVPHAIWYDSPSLAGFEVSVMYSPGQNAAGDSSDFPVGDNVCSGSSPGGSGSGQAGQQITFGGPGRPAAPGVPNSAGNNVGQASAGTGFGECTDGAFGDLYSTSVTYKRGNFTGIAALEYHHASNRVSDGVPGTSGLGQEYAGKLGAGYNFGAVKVYAMYEWLRRTNTPAAFNERSRDGVYGSLSWRFLEKDEFNAAYGHAFKTPGNPGVNTLTPTFCPGGVTGQDDAADLYALGLRHFFTPAITAYFVAALDHNHQCAHYGLGQSGHGIGYLSRNAGNETFAGKDIAGVSIGATFAF